MNLPKQHPKFALDREAKMSGVGPTAIWDGPFDSTGYPKGSGSSSGKDGMEISKSECGCSRSAMMPITQKVKLRTQL